MTAFFTFGEICPDSSRIRFCAPVRRARVTVFPDPEKSADYGLRYVEDVTAAAADAFDLERIVDMPANNLILVYRRR